MTSEKLDAQEREDDRTESADEAIAWSEIEPGRFMPRRIRGSYRGGKLG
jgi:hypothetical protein